MLDRGGTCYIIRLILCGIINVDFPYGGTNPFISSRYQSKLFMFGGSLACRLIERNCQETVHVEPRFRGGR